MQNHGYILSFVCKTKKSIYILATCSCHFVLTSLAFKLLKLTIVFFSISWPCKIGLPTCIAILNSYSKVFKAGRGGGRLYIDWAPLCLCKVNRLKLFFNNFCYVLNIQLRIQSVHKYLCLFSYGGYCCNCKCQKSSWKLRSRRRRYSWILHGLLAGRLLDQLTGTQSVVDRRLFIL